MKEKRTELSYKRALVGVGYASMPPTRRKPNSMPAQLDAKIYSLTFTLLFTSGVLMVSVITYF